ncbi:heterokaryon incompatibility protein-domain-containing protein [Stachybotrys elegans]|uniref:Heterokaryon incompatibility protein-domain-containing protein n=1 Tax=Stachybotrys elegans TaxID=80388 RepID=A0A8K0WKE7_9HYPO|nr:heterokaryon incompatibility protein-domain-containing protein [Stachybotrys elegans]
MDDELPLRLLSHNNGNFFVFETHQRPEVDHFDILSYTWGPTKKKENAYDCGIPGVEWRVVLQEQKINDIKQLMLQAGIQYLWVDSLCLDQNNEEETDQRITKIHQYYRNARRCHIMLGMSEAWHPQTIVDNLKYLDHVLFNLQGNSLASEAPGLTSYVINRLLEWENGKRWVFELDLPSVRSTAIEPGLLNCYATCISHVKMLFHNPYFSRVWTFQELILGRNICVWGMSSDGVSEIGEFSVWLDLATDAIDKAVKLRDWIQKWRRVNTTTIDTILKLVDEDIISLAARQVQVGGISSARTDIINGGPFWWRENLKGVRNIFSALAMVPRECERKPDFFRGLLGIFSGLFSEAEIQTELAGENLEKVSFAFFKQLSIKTGLAWTKLVMDCHGRENWSWIPILRNHENVISTEFFTGVMTLGRVNESGQATMEATTGLRGNPRKYTNIRLLQGNGSFDFIFKGCNCSKELKTDIPSTGQLATDDRPKEIVQDETGRSLVQCATLLGYALDPGCEDIQEYRRRLLHRLRPDWRISDPAAKPLGWVDRCVSGTAWQDPGLLGFRSHNMLINYTMVDMVGCLSRLAHASTANFMCEVTINCGCYIYAPFSLVFEALTAVEGSSLGGISATLDDDGRIEITDGLGLVQLGDVGRTFSLVAFGGDINAHKSHASICRRTKADQLVIPKQRWPSGRALVGDEFAHEVTDMMRDYGYLDTGVGNLLICRSDPMNPYKIVGVCVDDLIANKRGQTLVKID